MEPRGAWKTRIKDTFYREMERHQDFGRAAQAAYKQEVRRVPRYMRTTKSRFIDHRVRLAYEALIAEAVAELMKDTAARSWKEHDKVLRIHEAKAPQ